MQQLDKNKTVLVFDTETTGLPKNWKLPFTATDNWPMIVQFGMILQHPNGKQESFETLVKPPNGKSFPIDQGSIDTHGITDEQCAAEGIKIESMLWKFCEWYSKADILICHNTSFDHTVVSCEMVRTGVVPSKRDIDVLCTMKTTTDLCQIPGPYGNKWPKLQELHQYLFDCEFEGAHDALDDVKATLRCYNELIQRGEFTRRGYRNIHSYSLNVPSTKSKTNAE